MKSILGISAYYHDSAAALLVGGKISAAAQEERFTRKKHDSAFPAKAIEFCLKNAGIAPDELGAIVFYEKPLVKFERLLETYTAFAPKGVVSFLQAMPVWLKDKLFLKSDITKEWEKLFSQAPPKILFSEHHLSHAASAFFPSPFEEAAVLVMDGVGEWSTTSAWKGDGNKLEPQWEIRFPHSLGLLYSAFTHFTGFKVNSGEYKLMGLAPYGRPIYVNAILDNLLDLKADGSFRLNMDYFEYCTSLKMTGRGFAKLFGGPARLPESKLTQREMDLASSIQAVTEEVVLRLARSLHSDLGSENLCLAGGVALNCVANGRLQREGPFKNIWIQPAAGDSGGALGAALVAYHQELDSPRKVSSGDSMLGSYLGPAFSENEIIDFLNRHAIPYDSHSEEELITKVASELEKGKVIGWFQGRMEFGPRALGNRSILGDARPGEMQSKMNLKIKFRESFRPFAPAVLKEKVKDYFEIDCESPYMLLVAPVKKERRSDIPAVTHIDYSARVQTVDPETNLRFYKLLKEFDKKTGCAVLVNTSFNVRGEPLVCTPEDAYRCFRRTNMDMLVLENHILYKEDQNAFEDSSNWKTEFVLD